MLATPGQLKLLQEWNATDRPYPKDVCLHELFEAQVEKTPESPAVVFGGVTLTYRELNRRANFLALHLQGRGVGPDTLVGLFLDRSIEMVVGIYAILKAGGAYVPLDPEYPPSAIEFMLKDTGIPIILTREHLEKLLPSESRSKTVCLDSILSATANGLDVNPACQATGSNLAYVIYTSGSTGQPKGVMNEHRGIVNRLLWMQDEYRLCASDCVIQKTPYTFDVSVWEFFWPLICGARLVVARPGGHRDAAYLIDTIIGERVTTIHFVPSMLRIFLGNGNASDCRGLKRVFCSGEALPCDLQAKFFGTMESAELHNLYGPTEAAVDVTFWRCRRDSGSRVVPIGRPVANTRVYILDERMQPLPPNVPGELHIGGIQVARGYLNRPELTAKRFIPDPFGGQEGARLYKTGDVCRFLDDGNIEYLGRNDFQIKLRGRRIEPGEIEAVLGQHSAVRESLVTLREDTRDDKVLVAYVVPVPGVPISDSILRGFLRGRLPDIMVPAAFVMMDAFPLTPSGKTDRRALPPPDGHRPELVSEYMPAKTDVERMIASIWQSVLGLETTGLNDNFFDLGGDSLRMIQVHGRLREALGLEFPLLELFEYPTILSLASRLVSLERNQEIGSGRIIDDRSEIRVAGRERLRRRADRNPRGKPS